jgi:hypothetical protein
MSTITQVNEGSALNPSMSGEMPLCGRTCLNQGLPVLIKQKLAEDKGINITV